MKALFRKYNMNTSIVGGVVLLILLAGATGVLLLTTKPQENKVLPKLDPQEVSTNSFVVKSVLSKAKDRVLSLTLSGVTEPSQSLEVESQLSGSIKKIFVKEGAFIKKGAPILELSTEDRLQQLESAKALLKLREMQNAAAKRLAEKKFTSAISLADTEKNLSDARLALSQARLNFKNLIIRAPFDGVINQIYVEPGSVISNMSLDRKVCTFANLNPLHLIIYVTEKVYEQLELGKVVDIQLADGRLLEGKIIYISAVADLKTKTFKVKVSVPNPRHVLPSGMTAVASLPLKVQRTHELHPSWITLSKEGIMGILAIEQGISTFYPVTILDSSPSALFVSDLPEQVEIITLGQESIAVGTKVQTSLKLNQDRK
jgi:multidrug efflux system membrane fusion protein